MLRSWYPIVSQGLHTALALSLKPFLTNDGVVKVMRCFAMSYESRMEPAESWLGAAIAWTDAPADDILSFGLCAKLGDEAAAAYSLCLDACPPH